VVVASIVFVLVRLCRGIGTVDRGTDASAEQVRDIRSSLGLDLPVYEQYVRWFGRLLHGDMGRSLFSREPWRAIFWIGCPCPCSWRCPHAGVGADRHSRRSLRGDRRNAVSEVAFGR